MPDKINDIDAAARMSHRQLLGVLMVLLLLGVSVLWSYGLFGNKESTVPMSIMPVLMIVIIAALKREGRRIDARALEAMRKDELRQASQQRAYRNGFFAMLLLQPLLGVTLYGSPAGAAIATAASVTVGAVTVLGSLLWHDR